MTLRIDTDAQNAIADAMGDAFNSGTLEIRSGSQPASANDAATGTVLATISLPADAFGAAAAGVASKAGTWQDAAADADGTAGWFRMTGPGGETLDGSVTATSWGGDMELDDVNIVQNGTVTVTSFTITAPAS